MDILYYVVVTEILNNGASVSEISSDLPPQLTPDDCIDRLEGLIKRNERYDNAHYKGLLAVLMTLRTYSYDPECEEQRNGYLTFNEAFDVYETLCPTTTISSKRSKQTFKANLLNETYGLPVNILTIVMKNITCRFIVSRCTNKFGPL